MENYFYVYVLRSIKDNKFYTGFTNNIFIRVAEHNDGLVKSTKFRRPLELVYFEACRNKKDAMHREFYLKSTYGKRYIRNRLKNDLS